MGIVTSALHGLLHMFQWLQHVIAANWLTMGDGLVLWIPDSQKFCQLQFSKDVQGCPKPFTFRYSVVAMEHLLSFMGNSSTHGVFSNDTFDYQAYKATISHKQGVGGSCWPLAITSLAMQWPRNPTEKIPKKLCGSPWKVGRLKVVFFLCFGGF